ncbi:MAG: hypothetical protein U0841_25500 [Chloroflexia bacterium]
MYALINTVTYQTDNPPAEASSEQFAALIVRAPGYRGRFGLDAGHGLRLHIYLFDTVDALRSGLGTGPLHHLIEEHIRPHYADPSERIAAGTARYVDLASVLTGMFVRLELLPGDSEGALTQETGYLGHVTVAPTDGQPVIAAIYDLTQATASPATALRTWEGAVTVNDLR